MPGPNTPYSQLDFNQIFKQVFDEANDRLRVDASVTATIGDLVISAEESDIALKDRVSNNFLAIEANGSINANVVLDASGDSVQAWLRDGSGNAINKGQATMANSLPVTLASNQSALVVNVLNTAIVSVGNTTTSALGSGAVFTGSWEQIVDYGSIAVIVYSNVSSASQGLEMQFSSDGVNIDITEKYFYDSSHSNGDLFIIPTKSQYFRIKYTNGGSAQSTFRLETVYRLYPSGPTNLINSAIYDSSPAATGRSVIVGKTTSGGGEYINVKVTPSGALNVAATQDGTWNINNISGTISLPTGAATSANQTTANNSLSSIDSKMSALEITATGSFTAPGQTACLLDVDNNSSLTIIASGSWSGLIAVQGSVDGSTFQLLPIIEYGTRSAQLYISGNDNCYAQVGGFKQVRLIAVTMSGTANVSVCLNQGLGFVNVLSAGPAQFYATVNIRDGNNSAFVKGQNTMAESLPVTIASNQTNINVKEISSLVPFAYDYLSLSQAATTDTWTYKSGGAGGSTVATVTVTYTDATKATISNVART